MTTLNAKTDLVKSSSSLSVGSTQAEVFVEGAIRQIQSNRLRGVVTSFPWFLIRKPGTGFLCYTESGKTRSNSFVAAMVDGSRVGWDAFLGSYYVAERATEGAI